MSYNKSENYNGIDLAFSKNVIDDLNSTVGRYVPPHERRHQIQRPIQSSSSSVNTLKSQSAPFYPNSANNRPQPQSSGWGESTNYNAKWDSGRQSSSLSNSGTMNHSGNSQRFGTNSGKWPGERDTRGGEINIRYGNDGLCPPNKKLEDELFENITNTGINFEKYDAVQVETLGEQVPPPLNSFNDYDLGPVLTNNITLSTFTIPTPVQKNAIPIIFGGRDLMACAQTGSGKTAAFLFPMISEMVRNKTVDNKQPLARGYKVFPYALILAPTRELACQIHQETRKFTYRSHLKSVVVYGGADSKGQTQELERGCHILVATPGRLIDMMERNKICVSKIKYLCIDEADRMLDMGFEPQIRKIVAHSPEPGDRQTLMFSATFPLPIQRLAEDFLYGFIFLKVGRIGSTTDSITQRIRWIEDVDKMNALLDIIPTINGLTLVFTETKRMADHLEQYLYTCGFSAASIHGDRTQGEREAALDAFKSGQVQILVATDVAARGLDIQNVKHVINYDLPHDIDDYVHRIGRTGRAGNDGYATAFFNEKNGNIASDLVVLLEEAGQEVDNWLKDVSNRNSNRATKPRRGGYGNRGGGNGNRGGGNRGGYGGGYRSNVSYGNHGDSGGNYSSSSNSSKVWW
jgi:ATP-dependent RNA helicase DDX3X